MPGEIVPIAFFAMFALCAIALGPLGRAMARRLERGGSAAEPQRELLHRMERLEQAVDAMAVQVERIAEGQRFTTRLLQGGAGRQVVSSSHSDDEV